jgi:hypothetical protein
MKVSVSFLLTYSVNLNEKEWELKVQKESPSPPG